MSNEDQLIDEIEAKERSRAALPVQVPAGWKMVPLELTDEMVAAGYSIHPSPPGTSRLSDAFRAMLAASPPAPASQVLTEEETINYVSQYGGMCRDCADNNGVCPRDFLPCAHQLKAIAHVVRAINYGLENGFLRLTNKDAEHG